MIAKCSFNDSSYTRKLEKISVRSGYHPPIYFPNGSYTGEWKNNQKHGRGVYRWHDAVYSGEWNQGLASGHGVYIRCQENTGHFSKYDGNWACGKKQGSGLQLYADGRCYDGQWKDGVREGRGVMNYPDGSYYDGQWVHGIRNGFGTEKLASGDTYEGLWLNNMRHGIGRLKTASSGVVQRGVWCRGQLRCSTVDDQARATAPRPSACPIPPLYLGDPATVLQQAAQYYTGEPPRQDIIRSLQAGE